ncbi:MAG: ABC transporter permease [Acidobacteria bacterium]|nr:ABC transporter permease [Acidobacteriota bacterium]
MPTSLRHLAHLTWLETKIFVREPLGVIGSVAVPVLLFVVVGRIAAGSVETPDVETGGDGPGTTAFLQSGLPVFAAILIALSAVLSLVTIIAIYREGGILRRLRATPVRPPTILLAHVLVKLMFTAATLALMVLAGRRFYPVDVDAPLVSFTLALVLATWSLLSIGFVIASVVPTARFAQPLGALILYPMIPLSGLFAPIDMLPPALETLARLLPLTYAVSLLRGIWTGEPWLAHAGDVAALGTVFAVATAIASRVFRWE